jgi:hypothetical protein
MPSSWVNELVRLSNESHPVADHERRPCRGCPAPKFEPVGIELG